MKNTDFAFVKGDPQSERWIESVSHGLRLCACRQVYVCEQQSIHTPLSGKGKPEPSTAPDVHRRRTATNLLLGGFQSA